MGDLADWQKRVIAEKEELEEKVNKLTIFIDSSENFKMLSSENQALMSKQHYYMLGYLDCLKKRINNF